MRPVRDDRSVVALASPCAKLKTERFDRPWRDVRVFLHQFPSTSYWATFVEFLPPSPRRRFADIS
jgi:hypothetical protein